MGIERRGTWQRAPVYDRVFNRVRFSDDCWEWQGYQARGYGRIWVEGRSVLVHRWVLQWLTGQLIPTDLTVDHLCRNRACVRPEHLDVVSAGENVLRGEGITAINKRKQVCLRGHLLSKDNLYTRPNGARNCRICKQTHLRLWRQTQNVSS